MLSIKSKYTYSGWLYKCIAFFWPTVERRLPSKIIQRRSVYLRHDPYSIIKDGKKILPNISVGREGEDIIVKHFNLMLSKRGEERRRQTDDVGPIEDR